MTAVPAPASSDWRQSLMIELTASALLFDMDGTLVDSTQMVESIWSEFAAANGADPVEVIDFAHGRPSRDTIATFTRDATEVEGWNDQLSRWEAERFGQVRAIPGAVSLVNALIDPRWAVVTSALREPARQRLAATGFATPPLLIGADDVTRGKPDPEGYRSAATRLGVDPRDCVVFEDTAAGLDAGRAAGCTVVGVGESAPNDVRVNDMTSVSVESDGEKWRVVIGP